MVRFLSFHINDSSVLCYSCQFSCLRFVLVNQSFYLCVRSFHIKSVHLFIKTSAGVKRKHAYQTDDQENKHIHLDQEAAASDGFADLTTLVNMSSAVSLAVSQVRNVPALLV